MRRRAAAPPAGGGAGTHVEPGIVVAAHRRHYAVELDAGGTLECVLKGRSMTLACGDRVQVAREAAGGAIVAIEPRRSLLLSVGRIQGKTDRRERYAGARRDRTRRAGRRAFAESLDRRGGDGALPVRAGPEQVGFAGHVARSPTRFASYAALGYPVVRVSATHDISGLLPWVEGQHSVVIGQSGMGKSTLINALLPGAAAQIGEISDALRSGRHTTTSTALYRLPDGDGWLVDSPGMKVFGLAHCTPDAISQAFVELRDLFPQCRFRDCRHDREPGCAVQAAVAAGRVAPQRLALLQTLLREAAIAQNPAR